jgi:hypothetical protein
MPIGKSLDELKEIAKAKGGKCLSLTYYGTNGAYKFRCAKGHEWTTQGTYIFKGKWCSECNRELRKIKSFDKLEDYVKERGGSFERPASLSFKEKIKFRCKEGHEWITNATTMIFNRYWCPMCAREIARRKRLSQVNPRYLHLLEKRDVIIPLRTAPEDKTPANACIALQCDPSVKWFQDHVAIIPQYEFAKDQVIYIIRNINKRLFKRHLASGINIIVCAAMILCDQHYKYKWSQRDVAKICNTSDISARDLLKKINLFELQHKKKESTEVIDNGTKNDGTNN